MPNGSEFTFCNSNRFRIYAEMLSMDNFKSWKQKCIKLLRTVLLAYRYKLMLNTFVLFFASTAILFMNCISVGHTLFWTWMKATHSFGKKLRVLWVCLITIVLIAKSIQSLEVRKSYNVWASPRFCVGCWLDDDAYSPRVCELYLSVRHLYLALEFENHIGTVLSECASES